ncbi:MAG: hypothetical protein QOI13_3364 [Paraburkholderia sp.]|jgi:hypothetical protein|nr:hypothetical protein [Paraburkholderia sp.]
MRYLGLLALIRTRLPSLLAIEGSQNEIGMGNVRLPAETVANVQLPTALSGRCADRTRHRIGSPRLIQ